MSNGGRVLYVGGDERTAVDRLADAVEGAEVREATTAEGALERVAEGSVDCVVSAYRLPDADGLDLLSRLREREPGLPFVLHPAEGSERLASAAVGADATDYVSEATDDGIVDAVTAALDGTAGGRRERGAARVADLVRTIQARLVRARTTEEIDRGVCEAIVDTEPYAFAWVGEYDRDDGRVVPRASAGFEAGYLEAIEITADEGSLGQGPTGTAVRERTLETVQNIPAEPTYEPWRADAVERTYRSSAAVPLVHEDRLYGVLNVYADRTGAFDEAENDLLRELGATIAHAFHRIRIQEQYESQYRELFEEAPVMVALTDDADGGPIVEDCNRRFAAKLGYSREELRGRPLTDVYTAEAAAKLADGGYERALAGEFVTAERTLRTRDGVRLETLLQATPRRDSNGDIVGTHALYVDMTERRRAKEVIDRAEAMEASMDGMAILTEDGEYRYANQAHADIYGYDDPEVFLGNTWRMNYEAEEIERFESTVLPLVADGEEWRGEATGVRADGSSFPQELSLSPLADGRYICVVRDATERRRYERRLERQRDNLEILNQVVRHDIRNDLQVVLGYAESLREAVDDERNDHVERVVTSARDAVEITETAGDVAEVMLTADTETKPVGLRYVLNDRIGEVRSAYQDAVLTTDGAIPDVEVRADDMLGSVFRNLLTNAIEHNDEPVPEVTVSASVDDAVTVRVADNGPGIRDERKGAIFEEGEKDLDSEGTGLGLYLVATLVDRYDGDIRVADNDPKGTVFTVELPVAE
ncbi:PAS domain S-box protein [Haloplanus halophilus]|uniref:PAS domain S-box protein n=1 Tax=Haloplanus halophilus TaxID=2949993 RepID=UPI00203C7CE8|nr:PAS domain S-box protein [Haloplanus sp. GDY1]